MPRLKHSLLHHASRISPYLPPLLRATHDLPSAQSELRWLLESLTTDPTFPHTLRTLPYLPPILRPTSRLSRPRHTTWHHHLTTRLAPNPISTALRHTTRLRERHYPLQYILGTQPFHHLDLQVRPGVLIPRPETEELTTHLAELLAKHAGRSLNILDLCAGTGCISLLLATLLPRTKAVGVDISPTALHVMQTNKTRHLNLLNEAKSSFTPLHHDVLSPPSLTANTLLSAIPDDPKEPPRIDLLVSNPPYISHPGFSHDTARSVRLWEPKLALVPDGSDENVFYARIVDVAAEVNAKGVAVEVGSWEQGEVVRGMMRERGWESQIWGDFGGKGRTVVGWRKGGWRWLGEGPGEVR